MNPFQYYFPLLFVISILFLVLITFYKAYMHWAYMKLTNNKLIPKNTFFWKFMFSPNMGTQVLLIPFFKFNYSNLDKQQSKIAKKASILSAFQIVILLFAFWSLSNIW